MRRLQSIRQIALAQALLAASCAYPARAQSAAAPRTGALTLTLVDDSGVPVSGASVSIGKPPVFIDHHKAPTTIVPPSPNAHALLTSNARGQIAASALEPGEYAVCIGTPRALGIVSPCVWYGIRKISIAAGSSATPPALVLHRGGTLRVHLADSQNLLPHPDSIIMPSFTIGVLTATNSYIGMKASEQVTAAGRDYTIVVPFNAPLRLSIVSKRFRFADQSGAELLNGGNLPLTISPAQPTKDINISVIGSTRAP